MRDCKHGQLARSCNICDLEETIRCQQIVLDQIAEALGVEVGDVEGIVAKIEGLKRDAARWRFTQHPHYFETGPYDTDGDWCGYSVGLQPPEPVLVHWKERKARSLNSCIMGRGETLQEAIDKALAAGEAGNDQSKI